MTLLYCDFCPKFKSEECDTKPYKTCAKYQNIRREILNKCLESEKTVKE